MRRWRDRDGVALLAHPGYLGWREEQLAEQARARDLRRIAHERDQERTVARDLAMFGGSRIALEVYEIAQRERAEAARAALLAELGLEQSRSPLCGWPRGLKRP